MIYSIGIRFLKVIVDLIELIFIGAVVSFFVFFYVGQPLRVTGESMVPEFDDGEQIIAEKISVKTGEIQRSDILIFKHPDDKDTFIIKRVIGLPNEKIKIQDGLVYIDDKILDESYLPKGTKTLAHGHLKENQTVTIPNNAYAVFGDNRENSSDTRTWGFVHQEDIVGKGFMVYYPFSNMRRIN